METSLYEEGGRLQCRVLWNENLGPPHTEDAQRMCNLYASPVVAVDTSFVFYLPLLLILPATDIQKYKQLKQENDPHIQIEGKDTDDWMCIDFGSTVIHLMLPETREIYELEKLWTLRSYDDQLAQMVPESLPEDFIFGLPHQEQ
nr:mitochondrial assembly of ribosomal large subunit protein 1 isoform X2 [Chrysemys picta bellii]